MLIFSLVTSCCFFAFGPEASTSKPGFQNRATFFFDPGMELEISSLTRTAPLNFTNNSAIAAEADSGSGTQADPYVIEYRLIECNGTGSGIIFQDTTAYTIVRHCEINESGSSFGADASILINNATNIQLINVTLTDADACNLEIVYSTNVTVYNSTFDNATYFNFCAANNTNILIYNTTMNDSINNIYITDIAGENFNHLFDNLTLTNASPYEVNLEASGLHNFTFNNVFINSSYSVHDFYIKNVEGMLINNSRLYADHEFCMQADNMTNFLIENTHFNSTSTSTINEITNSVNVTFRNCSFLGLSTAIAIKIRNSSVNLYYNNFTMYEHAAGYVMLNIGTNTGGANSNVTIQYNYISQREHFIRYESNDTINLSHNFYTDYFDVHPFAVLVNTSSNVLNESINVSNAYVAPIEDHYPEYFRDWHMRDDTISINLYSIFDYLGVSIDLVKVYVNDKLRVRREMSCEYVVYVVEIYDFAGRLLYANSFNVNESTDLDIGLSIAALSVTNNFNYSVIFYYQIDDYKIAIPIGPAETYNLRVSTGSLTWWVTDQDGDILENEMGDDYHETINITGQKTIEFGWVTVDAPAADIINNYQISTLDYVLMLSILGAIIAIVFAVAFRLRTTRSSMTRSTKSRTNRSRSSRSKSVYTYSTRKKRNIIRF